MKKKIFLFLAAIIVQAILYQLYCFFKWDFFAIRPLLFYYLLLALFVIVLVFFYWFKNANGKFFFTFLLLLFLPMRWYYVYFTSIQKEIALDKASRLIQKIEDYKNEHQYYPLYFKDTQLTDTTYRVGFIKYFFQYERSDKEIGYHLSFAVNGENDFVYSSKLKEWDESD